MVLKRWVGLLFVLLVALPTLAQSNPIERVIVMNTFNGLTVAEQIMPNNTLAVDYRPGHRDQWARVDGVGIPRYHYDSPEGVYTAPPFVDGFSAPSAEENKIRVDQIAWSPRGDMFAFVIDNPLIDDLAHGVWFWQPLRELASDPSYQLLRQCPPYCDATTGGNGQQWHAETVEWSPDNNAILINLTLPLENNRRALTVRYANRDLEQTQAITAPDILRFDTGHWTPDGQNLIVSGRDASGQVVFGLVARDGTVLDVKPASEIGMAWVQSAIQPRDEQRLVMLGSVNGASDAHQLVDSTGEILTPPIGTRAPSTVEWSPDGTAVRVVVGQQTFIALTTGEVYDITNLVDASTAVAWIDGLLPTNASPLTLPAPEILPEATEEAAVGMTADTAVEAEPITEIAPVGVPPTQAVDEPVQVIEATPETIEPAQVDQPTDIPIIPTEEPESVEGDNQPTTDLEDVTTTDAVNAETVAVETEAPPYAVGDLLVISAVEVSLYIEPLPDAGVRGVALQGDELIITGGPVFVDGARWWRVQTLTDAGWLPENAADGTPVFAPVEEPTG